MHPAKSVIVFTTLSGLGFGLMFWMGLGFIDADHNWTALFLCVIAGALSTIGLLASTLHLGNPQRALKAFSQWRSSWLSREGVIAVATMLVFGLYALIWIFSGTRVGMLGFLLSILSLGTVYCTAMIYAQLKTVPRWHSMLTPALFIAFSLTGGAIMAGFRDLSALLLLVLAVLQWFHWRRGDSGLAGRGSTPETATGLGSIGQVRLLEAPHSGPNYLMNEMVYKIGRNRSRALRIATIFLAVILPLVLVFFAVANPYYYVTSLGFALLSFTLGTLASRWIFFAEAEHAVSLYYR